ncbi:hypothetical protein [Prosthecobacter sp.]|uniref:hypothetical protein n=1 Tax=Prosthecobacter sp. TaxID=1965333 RepID=UPI00378397D3
MNIDKLIDKFAVFRTNNPGIENFISPDADRLLLERVSSIDSDPLSKVQLNQLLGLRMERAVSDGFFTYYWNAQPRAPYKLSSLPGYSIEYPKHEKIINLDHFAYGLYRIFIDGLLYRGNVRAYFREFAAKSEQDITNFVESHLFPTESIKRRGPILPLRTIKKDSRYLISEMACKSYGAAPKTSSELKDALIEAWQTHEKAVGGPVVVKDLLSNSLNKSKYSKAQGMFEFSADDMLEDTISSVCDIESKYEKIADSFLAAREAALENTKLYLSMVNDLDVYVATSMRTRKDFRSMADRCEQVFHHNRLADLHLRYFDPTMSAADGHQDKGLIECLMVKCAKVLLYCAGEKESYGKDAEAAMALSLGKPVIFLCDEQQRQTFYKEVHPLSRLINFETGVAVGAIVTSKAEEVSELLDRLFENEMEYTLQQPADKSGYLQLVESITGSVVRLQTNDSLLAEAFWNYYCSQR